MIMPNQPPEFNEEYQNPQNRRRDFTRILRAAKPFWEEYLPEPDNHTARGLVPTASGKAFRADLSFNKGRKRVILVVRLHLKNDLSPAQLRSILKLQSRVEGLSSIAFDEESKIVRITSQSVLPAPIMANAVVPDVIKDAVALLEDDDLRDIVDHSASY